MAVQDHTNEWPPTGAPFDLHRDEHWTNFDSSVNAVSFGFVATAILISMFLVMAIFERFLRPFLHCSIFCAKSTHKNTSSCNIERDGFKSMEFVDLGFPDFLQKSFHGSKPMKTSGDVHGLVQTSSCELDSNNSSKRGNSSIRVIAFDSSFREEDYESKHLSSLFESKNHDSSLIDLKLGRLLDCQGASNDRDAKASSSTLIHQTVLSKRARTSTLSSRAPVCQVYDCNMDLSTSKDYQKRHKVCDVHSKTAKFVVNGVEQRFCQQCSRFHLVAEFDDGKRSCRRRLAGHNERRRKPQFDYMTSKQHKILKSYQGTNNFSFQDIFQSGILFSAKHDQISQSGRVKLEEEPICSPQLEPPATLGHDLSSRALSLLSSPSRYPSSSPLPSAAAWWKTTEKYKVGSSALVVGKQFLHPAYTLGKNLKGKDLLALATKFNELSSITVVLTAKDVNVDGFCMSRCGTHGSVQHGNGGVSARTPYIWVGNAETLCPGQCAWPFHQPIYGPQTSPLVAPNGDVGVDGMIINLATLLAGTVTNPFNNGYFQGPATAPLEAVTACTGVFGSGSYPGYAGRVLVDKTTGSSYNAHGANGRRYLLPAMWDPQTSACRTLV